LRGTVEIGAAGKLIGGPSAAQPNSGPERAGA
jgi:hypothetical protein